MTAAATSVFLLARILLMSADGTDLISEHRASVPEGGTGIVHENLRLDGLPGAVQIRITPERLAIDPNVNGPAGNDAQETSGLESIRVYLRVNLFDSAADAPAGRAPREINTESLVLTPDTSGLVQLAEDPDLGRRLMLSLTWLAEPDVAPAPPALVPPEPGRINFRIEVYRGSRGARELLERHFLMTLERSPVTWETRWKRPLARADGSGLAYRDEGLTLRLRPVIIRSGWISVEASLSALLYAEGETDPLRLSSTATRTVAIGIPFEILLEMPAEQARDGGEPAAPSDPSTVIVEVTPYRAGG